MGRTQAERQAGVRATVAKFWRMLGDPPRTLPYQMPMTAAVAPTFATRYPEAAIIFDNLHSMHDVISDVLANPAVPRDRKRAEILLAWRRYRDDTTLVMASTAAWRTMAFHMGIENMGGPAVGLSLALPTPTVTYGAVPQHDDRTGQIVGFAYGRAVGGAHGSAPAMAHGSSTHVAEPGTSHPGMVPAGVAAPGAPPAARAHAADMTAMHTRMMADSVIRRRVPANPEMRRIPGGTADSASAGHHITQPPMTHHEHAPPTRARTPK